MFKPICGDWADNDKFKCHAQRSSCIYPATRVAGPLVKLKTPSRRPPLKLLVAAVVAPDPVTLLAACAAAEA
jgi:hypothetical protein